LNGVAGNHARSYFEMAPASIVLRLTRQLVAGYSTYGFESDGNYPEVVDGLKGSDFAGQEAEFYIGGKIVKEMPPETAEALTAKGVTLDRDPRKLLATVGEKIFPAKGE
jgi:CRISPR-associated protein Cst2